MRLLYVGFEEFLRKTELLAPKLVDLPIVSDVTNTVVYLGPADPIEVELKVDKHKLGWLYNKGTIVFFRQGEQMYEVFASTLKELAEEKFASKKMLKDGEEPSPGALKRNSGGKIVGYLDVNDVIAVSNRFEYQEG